MPKRQGENEDYGIGGKISSSTDLSGTVIDNVYYNIPNTAGGYDTASGSVVLQKSTVEAKTGSCPAQGIYTLQGVKVGNDAGALQLLPRGVYIVNGRKVAVK